MIGSKDHFQKKNANYFVKAAKLSTLRAKSRLNFCQSVYSKYKFFIIATRMSLGFPDFKTVTLNNQTGFVSSSIFNVTKYTDGT